MLPRNINKNISVFAQRTVKLQKTLIKQKLDALIVTSNASISYITGYHNFSMDEREAYLLITPDDALILTDRRYTSEVKNIVKHFKVIEINTQNTFPAAVAQFTNRHQLKNAGFEDYSLTAAEYLKLKGLFANFIPLDLGVIRTIKDTFEINYIKTACKIADSAFEYILENIKPGISERELANLLEMYIKQKGADLAFKPIIAFGKNAAIPHHQTNDHRLTTKDLALLDFGVKYENYCSDMTRTVFIGNATQEQKKVYKTVKHAQEIAIQQFNNITIKQYNNKTINETQPVKASDLDRTARDYIISQGYPSVPHSIGHGIGLQVHEPPALSPKSKHILEEGMVFSIEPGVYLTDYFGIRIEDLFVIDKRGLHQLTKSPKKITEI